MKIDLKQCIRTIYQLADIIEKTNLGISRFSNYVEMKEHDKSASTKKVIQMEMIQFAVHLIGSDGKILQSEIDFLNEYLQLDIVLNAEIIRSLMKDMNMTDDNLACDVSVGITIFRNADAGLREKKYLQDDTDNIGEFLYSVYEILGKEIMVADSKITEKEIAIYTKYMNVFREALNCDEYLYANSIDSNKKI